MATLLSRETLGVIGMALVGMVFVGSALVKTLDPRGFTRHVAGLRILPAEQVRAGVYGLIAFEVVWGVALLTGFLPELLLPATLVLLAGLSGMTYWSTSTGRAMDCGCYGGGLQVTPAQSLLLNGLYVAVVVASYRSLGDPVRHSPWKLAVALAAGAAAGLLAFASDRRAVESGSPLLNLEPLQVGRRWKRSWAGGGALPEDREVLIVYLGPTCPHCQRWVRILNVIHQVASLPDVIGVTRIDGAEKESFVSTFALRFPVHSIPAPLMSRLADAVPTTVLVAKGRIQDKWVGQMPEGLLQRFRSALFPFLSPAVAQHDGVASPGKE